MYILAILQVEEECVFEKIKNHRGTAFMIKELSQNQPVRYSRRPKQHLNNLLICFHGSFEELVNIVD